MQSRCRADAKPGVASIMRGMMPDFPNVRCVPYMREYVHAWVQQYARACVHARMRACACAHMRMHADKRVHAHVPQMRVHTPAYACAGALAIVQMHALIRACKHACMCVRTSVKSNACACAPIHAQMRARACAWMGAHACHARACASVCMRACAYACVHACVRLRVRARTRACLGEFAEGRKGAEGCGRRLLDVLVLRAQEHLRADLDPI